MNEFYRQERERQARISRVIGIALAVLSHVVLLIFGVFSGLKYIYPPPPEQAVLIDFVETERQRPVQQIRGTQPKSVNANPEEDINLVQKSEAQLEGTRQNEAQEATVGEDGDVEVPEPPRPKEINKRALFHAADNKTQKDTLAPQTASEATDKLKAGHASGNTNNGKLGEEPNARVKGRTTVGTIPRPGFSVQKEGIVVVDIMVDQNGRVTSAMPGGDGTTVVDKELWAAAKKAAMETYFNVDLTKPIKQSGTITYKFKLTK